MEGGREGGTLVYSNEGVLLTIKRWIAMQPF